MYLSIACGRGRATRRATPLALNAGDRVMRKSDEGRRVAVGVVVWADAARARIRWPAPRRIGGEFHHSTVKLTSRDLMIATDEAIAERRVSVRAAVVAQNERALESARERVERREPNWTPAAVEHARARLAESERLLEEARLDLSRVRGEANPADESRGQAQAGSGGEEATQAEGGLEARVRFLYERDVLKEVARAEEEEARASRRSGEVPEADACAARAAHINRLLEQAERTGRPVWRVDVVGRCLREANLRPPELYYAVARLCARAAEADNPITAPKPGWNCLSAEQLAHRLGVAVSVARGWVEGARLRAIYVGGGGEDGEGDVRYFDIKELAALAECHGFRLLGGRKLSRGRIEMNAGRGPGVH